MLTAVLVVVAAVAAWLAVDWSLARRDQRLRQGAAAWTHGGPDRNFHSTGWEDTVPPLEAVDEHVEALRAESRREAAA